MMGSFFESRKTLTGVVQLVDIRHDPSRLDAEMYEYLRSFGLSGIVAATKADKVSGNEKSKNIALIKKTLMQSCKKQRQIRCFFVAKGLLSQTLFLIK